MGIDAYQCAMDNLTSKDASAFTRNLHKAA
jgi:hypothetical protein